MPAPAQTPSPCARNTRLFAVLIGICAAFASLAAPPPLTPPQLRPEANALGEVPATIYGELMALPPIPDRFSRCSRAAPVDGALLVAMCRGLGHSERSVVRPVLLKQDAGGRFTVLQLGEAYIGAPEWSIRTFRAPFEPPLIIASASAGLRPPMLVFFRVAGGRLVTTGHVLLDAGSTDPDLILRTISAQVGSNSASLEFGSIVGWVQSDGQVWRYPAHALQVRESRTGIRVLAGSAPQSPSMSP